MFSKKDYYHRLSKYLAYSGISSRRQSESLITSGQISVNGIVVTSVSQKVSPKDVVRYNGKKVLYKSKPRMWIYHKPVGELCSDFDPSGKKTVFDSFPKKIGKVNLVGRLDLNSEGLLLLTNKGYIKRYLELPKNKIIRTYLVKTWGKDLNAKNIEEMSRGVEISEFKYAPLKIEIISKNNNNKNNNNNWYNIKLIEGKNREIRKILGYFGLKVKKLIRIGYGDFFLNSLKVREVIEIPVPKSLLYNAKKD